MSQGDETFIYKYGGDKKIKFYDFKSIYRNDLGNSKKALEELKEIIEKVVEKVQKKTVRCRVLPEEIQQPEGSKKVPPGEYRKITQNEKVEDCEKLVLPYLGDGMDHDAVVERLSKVFPVIVGYHSNKYTITDRCFFYVMRECLKEVKSRDLNPDLLYYALYLTFPLRGTQNDMARIFPSLVEQFQPQLDYLDLEPWKRKVVEPVPRKFISYGNHFAVSLNFPLMNDCHAPPCFLTHELMNETAQEALETSSQNSSIRLYLSKSVDLKFEKYFQFIDDLFSRGAEPVEFCEMVQKYSELGSCAHLFDMLFHMNSFITEPIIEEIPRCDENRLANFEILKEQVNKKWSEEVRAQHQKQMKKARKNPVKRKELKKKFANIGWYEPIDKPCVHFGPCGPDVPSCSCKSWCTASCQCDNNCPRRYPGCRCSPEQCGTDQCPCAQLEIECVKGMCQNCMDDEDDEDVPNEHKCKNYVFHRGEESLVENRPSLISGTGAFLKVDAKRRQFVGEYIGQHISENEYYRRCELDHFRIAYHFDLPNLQGSIDSQYAGNEMRFINHDDNPNLTTFYRLVDGKPRIGFNALNDMRAGTELTFDYQYSEEDKQMYFFTEPKDRVYKTTREESTIENDQKLISNKRNAEKPRMKSTKRTKI